MDKLYSGLSGARKGARFALGVYGMQHVGTVTQWHSSFLVPGPASGFLFLGWDLQGSDLEYTDDDEEDEVQVGGGGGGGGGGVLRGCGIGDTPPAPHSAPGTRQPARVGHL